MLNKYVYQNHQKRFHSEGDSAGWGLGRAFSSQCRSYPKRSFCVELPLEEAKITVKFLV